MSGYSPDWIKKDQYFLLNGKKEIVEDYFFTANPVHNSDRLHVVVNGVAYPFNAASMKALDARGYHVPQHIRVGNIIELDNGQLDFVSAVWVQKSIHDKKATVKVCLCNHPFGWDVGDIKPLSDKNKSLAADMMRARAEKKERVKAIGKWRQKLNSILKH